MISSLARSQRLNASIVHTSGTLHAEESLLASGVFSGCPTSEQSPNV